MRAHDFDNPQTAINYFSRRSNIIGRIDLGDYTAFLDDHLMLRQQGRGVDEFVIREVVPKIPRAKAKIKALDTGQSFYLYDNTNDIALGIKILHQPYKIFLVKTVWDGMPSSDNNYPIFNVA
jgi:hypothetical protein